MSEPKLSYPVLRNGELTPVNSEDDLPSDEPKIALPNFGSQQQKPLTKNEQFKLKMKEQAAKDNAATRARLRGLTFGLSDRAEAGIDALLGKGKYEDNLRRLQAERDAYRSEHPISAGLNELLGGVVSGGAASGLVRGGLSMMAPKAAASLATGTGLGAKVARVAAPIAEGAAFGELGAQAEKGYGQVGTDLGKGALYGAGATAGLMGVGKLAGTAGKVASKAGKRVKLATGMTSPERFADDLFQEHLARDNMDPKELLDNLKFLRADDMQPHGPSIPGHDLPDVSTPVHVVDQLPTHTEALVHKGIRAASAEQQAALSSMIKNRNSEQAQRIREQAARAISPDMNATEALERLQAARKVASDPHYQKAYAIGTVDHPDVDRWLVDRNVNRQLFETVKSNLENNASKTGLGQGRAMEAVMDVDANGNPFWKKRPSIQDLDTMKKVIDDRINDLKKPDGTFRKPKNPADPDHRQLMNQRDDLISLIDRLTPDGKGGSHYANARKAFADDTELLEAQEAGMKMLKMTRASDAKKLFDQFSKRPELKEQFRAGVASAINDAASNANVEGGKQLINKLWGSEKGQRMLEMIMSDDTTRATFRRNMAAEKAFTKLKLPGEGGKKLANDTTNTDALLLSGFNLLTGRPASAMNHLSRYTNNVIGGVNEDVGNELTKMAMRNPEEYADWLAKIEARNNSFGARGMRAAGGLARYLGRGAVVSGANRAGAAANTVPYQDEDNP